MLEIHAQADATGVEVLAAAVSTAVRALGCEADAGAVVRLVGHDALARLGAGIADARMSLDARVDGTEFVVVLSDRGEPIDGPPEGLLDLVAAGAVTSIDARAGDDANVVEVRFVLPAHVTAVDISDVTPQPDDVPTSDVELTIRPFEPSDARELARTIYRCYGWTYPIVDLYHPERVAEQTLGGARIGEVAVTSSGEIAAHWGALYLTDSCVETGGTVTDPRFRGRGLAGTLGDRLLARLRERHVIGRLREPVMTHPATQHIALTEGATIVGAYLHYTRPIQQVGITAGLEPARGSICVAYSALEPLTPAELSVPSAYRHLVESIVVDAGWPRTFSDSPLEAASSTEFAVSFDTANQRARIDVTTVGTDLIDALDHNLAQLHESGVQYVGVRLPATDQALAHVGADLPSLGLGFAAYIPEFWPADVLILQWLASADVDTTHFVYASPAVESRVQRVLTEVQQAEYRGRARARRARHGRIQQ
ncbi:MAG: hypothetical protein FJW97_01075 [Actinobacteria bacterium]|nr:hypothetical protein [Actinomycetota bacterium]